MFECLEDSSDSLFKFSIFKFDLEETAACVDAQLRSRLDGCVEVDNALGDPRGGTLQQPNFFESRVERLLSEDAKSRYFK